MNRPAPVRLDSFAADRREPYRFDPFAVLSLIVINVVFWSTFIFILAGAI